MNSGATSTEPSSCAGRDSGSRIVLSWVCTTYASRSSSRCRFQSCRMSSEKRAPIASPVSPSAATTMNSSVPPSKPSHSRIAAPSPASVRDGLDRRVVDRRSVRRRDERDTRFAQRALATGRLLLLTDQSGHPRDDEQEQDDRRDDHHHLVGALRAGRVPAHDDRVGERGGERHDREDREPRPRQTCPHLVRALGERADGRDAAPRRRSADRTPPSRPRGSRSGCRSRRASPPSRTTRR